MGNPEASAPNAEQIAYWNGESGPKWVALQELLDAQIAPLGLAAMDRAAVSPGERVVDVGCGCGQTSLQLGERVGSGGSVHGVDISGPMLTRARERAAAAGLAHVRFTQADAQTQPLEPGGADLVFSRFGVMFFEDPVAAFRNLFAALAPGGRLAFVAWQELSRNPWMLVPVMAVAPLVEMPPPPAPGAPGPFAFADGDRVRALLAEAGFESIELLPLAGELLVGGSGGVASASDFVLQMGPAGRVLRGAAPEVVARAREAVRAALAPFATPGGVRIGCSAHVLTARRLR